MRFNWLIPASFIAALAASSAAAQTADPAEPVSPEANAGAEEQAMPETQPTLDELLWVARPIVVFADTPNDPRFLQQMDMLGERPGELDDRDAVILVDTDPAAKGPLRTKLRPRGFGLVLVDKDGTVVQRRPAPTTARELINLIDRLPSRRQETGSRRQ